MARQTDRLDMSVPFQPVNIAVMTVSDTRTEADDRSGDLLAARIAEDGHVLADRAIITDDVPKIIERLQSWVEDPQIDVVVTTGGTGLTGRDSTLKLLMLLSRRKSAASANCSGCCPIRKSAPRRYSRGRWPVWLAAPICSRFRGRPLPARMAGMIFCGTSSISATNPAILSRSCRGCPNPRPPAAADDA